MQEGTTYTPIIKGRGFMPNPIAVHGIPPYADSKYFPQCEGTAAWEEFWKQQIHYCTKGYDTGGIHIPGRYYFYLNFCYVSTQKRGMHHPEFVDLDLEFFRLVEYVKKNGKGIINMKPRRKGVSEKAKKGIIAHGLVFSPGKYHGGISSGNKEYTKTFYDDVRSINGTMPPELQMNYLIDNNEQLLAGYEEEINKGVFVKSGSFNQLLARTMVSNPNLFKGEFLDDGIFEEAGEYPLLKLSYDATQACFESGGIMVGTPYVYGTGGNFKSSVKEFQEMWHEADAYHLERFEFYGDRLMVGFFIGSKNVYGELAEDCPYLKQDYPDLAPEQLLGCEDTKRSAEVIREKRIILSKAKDRKRYFAHLTDYPLNRRELFTQFTGASFDPDSLSMQRTRIDELPATKYINYNLEWVRDDEGRVVLPLQVKAILAPPNTSEDDCTCQIYKHPNEGIKHLFCAGVDSYDQDQSAYSKSLGAMLVLARKGHSYKSHDGALATDKRIPVCVLRQRPKRKEKFYENCLKIAVYYDLKKSVMIDYSKPLVMKYFQDNGGTKYLAKRPLAFESEKSEQQQDYGMLLTSSPKSKPQMIGLMQSWVLDEADECWFPKLIDELLVYNVDQKESDWDLADALGLALVQDVSTKRTPSSDSEEEYNKKFDLGVSQPDEELKKIFQRHGIVYVDIIKGHKKNDSWGADDDW